MSFKNPEYLLLIPLFLFLLFLKLRQKPAAVKYSLSAFIKVRVRENRLKKYLFVIVRTAAVTLLVVAMARPRQGLKERTVVKPAVDIMIVMDVSTSMKALDFAPLNRMEAAVKAAKEFITARTSDRLGVVVFSGLPVLHCPLTLDHNAVLRLMDNISPGMVEVDGTAIGMGMALGLRHLEKSEAASKVMVLLTDGANNAGDIDPATAAEMAAALGIKVYTIGCGKPGPAKVPVDHPFFGRRLVAIPDELDEAVLKSIASETGGKYFRATSLKEMKKIYSEIDSLEKKQMEVTEYYEFEEKFPLFLYSGSFLVLFEVVLRIFLRGIFI